LRITDPRHDKIRIETDKGGLQSDVYRWVLSNGEFLRWWHDAQNALLWIRGNPGTGKTMLLCGVIDELSKESGALSYFFCQATDRRMNNATAVLRGLIYMLVDRQPSLLRHVQKRYEHAGRQVFEDVNAWVAVRDVFLDILRDPDLRPPCLVIDALDECQTGRPELLDLIVSCSTASRVKWIVSSRNLPDIAEKL
ncbi:NACHT domain-containing protein, partial [Coniochaeta sp. 2T2.1]